MQAKSQVDAPEHRLGPELEVTLEKDQECYFGWERAWSEKHKHEYYYNRETKERTWIKPAITSASAGPSQEIPTAFPTGAQAKGQTEAPEHRLGLANTSASAGPSQEMPTAAGTAAQDQECCNPLDQEWSSRLAGTEVAGVVEVRRKCVCKPCCALM